MVEVRTITSPPDLGVTAPGAFCPVQLHFGTASRHSNQPPPRLLYHFPQSRLVEGAGPN